MTLLLNLILLILHLLLKRPLAVLVVDRPLVVERGLVVERILALVRIFAVLVDWTLAFAVEVLVDLIVGFDLTLQLTQRFSISPPVLIFLSHFHHAFSQQTF